MIVDFRMSREEYKQLKEEVSRYRWLRDCGDLAVIKELIEESSTQWDSVIDAAMSKYYASAENY